MTTLKRILTASMVIGILLTVFGAGTAMATTATPSSPVTVTVERNEQHASSGVFIQFRILSYIKAEGLTKEEVRESEGCRMIGEGTNVPEYTNSGYTPDGHLFKFRDTRRTEVCKINGQWRKVICGNFIWFSVEPTVFRGQVLMVKTFAQKKIRLHIPLKVKVTSKCGYAYAAAKIDQWVRLKALVRAKGDVKIRINGKILDRAKSHVKVESVCETTEKTPEPPPPGCSTCKPPAEPPVVNNLETINDMEVSSPNKPTERTICADVYAPAGDSLTIVFHAEYGSFAGNVEFRSAHRVCDRYSAPTEVPPGGKEEYWVFVQDNTTGLHAESEHKTFPLHQETSFEP